MILFRADADKNIGAGHVMRCLSLADAAARLGESCVFFSSPGKLDETILRRGHKLLRAESVVSEEDAFEERIRELKPSAVIVDSYRVTEKYLGKLKLCCEEMGSILVYIDDVLAFPYPCHLLINYNIFAKEEPYTALYGEHKPGLLLGPQYAPLRQEFAGQGNGTPGKEARNVLVSTGGADPGHMSSAVMKAAEGSSLCFHLVLGALHPERELLRKRAEGSNVLIHEDVRDMAALMKSCDIAIAASGSTLYELCAMQLPTLCYVLEDNQIALAEGFAGRGIMKNCGDIRRLGSSALAERLVAEAEKLSADLPSREGMAEAMRAVTDGRGAERIMEYIIRKGDKE